MKNFDFSSCATYSRYGSVLGPVHTNPFSNENRAVLLRFQKDLHPHLSFSYRFRPSTLQCRICFENTFIPSVRMLKSTRRMRISIYRPAKLARNGSVCPPFWILTVEWSGARSWLFSWRHRFQIASFSPSTLENSVFKKHRFQIAPLWRAFSNGSIFGDRFRRCTIAVSGAKQLRFRLKTD